MCAVAPIQECLLPRSMHEDGDIFTGGPDQLYCHALASGSSSCVLHASGARTDERACTGLCLPLGGVAVMEKAFWRFDEDGPLFGAPSQERFSFLADLSSCPFAGAGVRRSCCSNICFQ